MKRQHESGAEKRKKKKQKEDARASLAGKSVQANVNCFANLTFNDVAQFRLGWLQYETIWILK